MKSLLLAFVALNLVGSSPQPVREGWAWDISCRDTRDPKLTYIMSGLPGFSLSDANDPRFMRQYEAKYFDHPSPRLFVRVYRDEIKVRTIDGSSWTTMKRNDVLEIRWQKNDKT